MVGNGAFSLLSSPLGISPADSFAAGVYDDSAGDVPRIARLPAWNVFQIALGSVRLDDGLDPIAGIRSYSQTLDMFHGTLHTVYDWFDKGRRISVEVVALVSRANRRLGVVRVRLVPHQSGPLTVRCPFHEWAPPRRMNLERLDEWPPGEPITNAWYPGQTTVTERHGAWLSLKVEGRPTRVAIVQAVSSDSRRRPQLRDSTELELEAVAGKPLTLTKFVGVSVSSNGTDPLPDARNAVEHAATLGYSRILAEHQAAWERLWSTDVIVEGNADLQRVLHAMQFSLLSNSAEGSSESIPPMGLSSAGFYGHVFWDADTWMFPVLAVTHPELSRSIVSFRSRTMQAAQQNARSNTAQGAKFPWEADDLGNETTPHFAQQNARSEVHVTGGVALAQWQFFLLTGDRAWLEREGFPVIKATADFWVSRVSYDAADGGYHIRDVVSVDEGLIGVNDDAYTNAVARRNLEIAVTASLTLGQEPDPLWAQIASKLIVPFDVEAQRHQTYAGASAGTRSSAVPLLAYPLRLSMEDSVKRRDLLHTLSQRSNRAEGAMMSSVLYPVVAAELGEESLLNQLLPTTYQPYLRGPFHVLAEQPSNDAINFVTGAGAFLQQVIYGYTGLRLEEGGLRACFKPMLPAGIRRLVLRNFVVDGRKQDVVVDRSGLRFEQGEVAA